MNITGIEIQGWMAYRQPQNIRVAPAPIAVVAEYASDPRRSNWGGKTALLEAIRWAITGRHRKSREDRIVNYGSNAAVVKLVFSDGAIIERSRPMGGPTRVAFQRADEPSSTGASAETDIELYLGMSADDLDATLFFGQSDIEGLVSRTSAERRKLVLQWLGLNAWNDYAKRARETLGTVQLAYATAQARATPPQESIEDATATMEATRVAAASAKAELDAATAKIEAVLPYMRDFGAEARLRDAAANFTELRNRLRLLGDTDIPEELQARHRELFAQVQKSREEISALAAAIRGFDGTKKTTCPIVSAECPSSAWVQSQGEAIQVRIEHLRKATNGLGDEYQSVGEKIHHATNAAREAQRIKGALESVSADMAKLRVTRNALLEALDAAGLTPQSATELAAHRHALAATSAEAATNHSHAAMAVKRIANDHAAYEKAKKAVEELDDKLAAARIVVDAVAPSGIPARVAEARLSELESRANALLVDAGLRFEFGWERELKDLTPSCTGCGYAYKGAKQKECPSCGTPRGRKRSDELDILVDDGTAELEDVREKSGGARVLVACAIRLAAAAMLRDSRGSQMAFALVDEPFGALDAANRDLLAKNFASMIGSVGLEQAFVVSHDASLLDGLPHRLLVRRNDDESTLEFT